MKKTIPIPDAIISDQNLANWITKNPRLFEKAMDLDASVYGEFRPTVMEDSISITDVQIAGSEIFIEYTYQYYIYEGCRDRNRVEWVEDQSIKITRQGQSLVFEEFQPREARSTADEL